MADLMTMGATAFKQGMPEEEIKLQHPQFRTGWRNAKKLYEAKNTTVSSLRVERVEKPIEGYVWELQWTDLSSITSRAPWNKLDSHDELKVLAHAMRKVVWDRRHTLTGFSDAVNMVQTIWESLLQYGYDEGVLVDADLIQYGFKPKQKQT